MGCKAKKVERFFLRAAFKYRAMGFSLIPCAPGGKKALVKWKVFQERCPSELELSEWARKWPNANIGIVTGKISGLVVLDIDGPRGRELVKGVQISGKTPLVQTHRGYHLYYAYPNCDVRTAKIKELDTEVRADGSYVLAPPSIHPDGGRYEWLRDLGPSGLPGLPVNILKLIEGIPKARKKKGHSRHPLVQPQKNREDWNKAKKKIKSVRAITQWLLTPKPEDRSGHDWCLAKLCLEHGIKNDRFLHQIILHNKFGKARTREDQDQYVRNLIGSAKRSYRSRT